jgi:hypothetical protein
MFSVFSKPVHPVLVNVLTMLLYTSCFSLCTWQIMMLHASLLQVLVISQLEGAHTAYAAVLALGQAHTCVIMSVNGGVRCWGSNGEGQVGATYQ